MKWYEDMSRTIEAYQNCLKSNNTDWEEKHEEHIQELINKLPHGSGIDGKWVINYDKYEVIELGNFYHAMDENGFYVGYIDFTVKIVPSLAFGCKIKIIGNFGKRQDIKEYLRDILSYDINQEIKGEMKNEQ